MTSVGTGTLPGVGVARTPAPGGRPRTWALGSVAALVCLVAAVWAMSSAGPPATSALSQADVQELLAGLRFEANHGQVDGRIDFVARGAGYEVSLSNRGASIGLERGGTRRAFGMSVLGASAGAPAAGVGDVAGRSNYLIGSDPRRWHRNVPAFERVRYRGVYPGIDLVYRGSGERLEYDFVVAPGADPARIALGFTGGRVSLAANGDLLVRGRGTTLRQKRPFTYQRVGGATRTVPSGFVLAPRGRVTFELGRYDRSRPLVIDPQLVYSSYLGGGAQGEGQGGPGVEAAEGVAVDGAGNAYIVGGTNAIAPSPYPTKGSFQGTNAGGADAVVTKLNPAGDDIVYSTYLGGGAADRAYDIAVNAAGEAYVTGQTASPGTTPATAAPFPTRNPTQAANAGGANDVFVAKLNAAGNDLVYSTYLGGSGSDRSFGIALDSTGAAHVAGTTAPPTGTAASPSLTNNFPTTPGAFQTTFGGGASLGAPSHAAPSDAFMAKLGPTGSAVFSTYLGGTGADGAEAIDVDPSTGVAHVAGGTASAAFPVTAGALQTTRSAAASNTQDGFVARVKADGSALDYATFLGGSASDVAAGVAVDAAGAAYVTGATASDDFPLQAPLQSARGGVNTDEDVFVTKLNAAGSAAVYSTYFGGRAPEQGASIDVDATGAVYVGGTSEGSGNFPLTNPIGRGSGNQDALLFKLDPTGSAAVHSSLLGGSDGDLGFDVAVGVGGVYLVGQANAYASPPGNFPTTAGAFQAQPAGGAELFVAKVTDAPTSPLVTSLRSRSGPVTGGTRVTINGAGLSGATAVRFGATPAASFTVESDTRITAVSPARALGRTPVTVTTPGGTTPPNPAATFEYAEGTWTLTGSLTDPHFSAPIVLLADGRVLLPSGETTRLGPTTGSSEIYNPKTRVWAKTGDMATSRHTHTATLLSGPACRGAAPPAYCGKVLVAGGFPVGAPTGNQPVLDSAELFDPSTGTWSGAGTMTVRRALHAAALLDGPPCHGGSPPSYCGKVLVVGGRTCDQAPPAGCAGTVRTSTAELYDPATGSWTATGAMDHARNNFDIGVLPNGGVVAMGGFGTGPTTAEFYDPADGNWGITGGLRSRTRSSAAVLPDGRVLAASGFGAGNTADVYNPATFGWDPTGEMRASYRFNYFYATLPSGKVLVAGGSSGGETSEAYDQRTNEWVSTGLLSFAYGPIAGLGDTTTAVVLSSDPDGFAADAAECGDDCGKVLVAGNNDDKTAELYTPPPRVDVVSPANGPAAGGTVVTVIGQGFTHDVRQVLFGDTPAQSFSIKSYGELTAVAPAGSGAQRVTVVNEGGSATSPDTFAYAPAATPTPPPPSDSAATPPPPPPPSATPPPPPTASAPSRVRGRLSMRVTPTRDLRAPYRFTTTGRLTLPRGVTASTGCRGRVSVQVKRGASTISTRRVSLRRNCTFSSVVTFASRARFASSRSLRFTVRFLGNARISPVTAASRFVRVRLLTNR